LKQKVRIENRQIWQELNVGIENNNRRGVDTGTKQRNMKTGKSMGEEIG
jgi:hypothetical protein